MLFYLNIQFYYYEPLAFGISYSTIKYYIIKCILYNILIYNANKNIYLESK